MNPDLLSWLRSSAGTALLTDLAARDLREQDALRELTRLRRHYHPDQARAALDQALLRRRAAGRLPHAEALFYTRDALEQLSAQPVADWRAQRIANVAHSAADLGCGIGGDSLALARAGLPVIAVDRDPLRLAITSANAEILGLDHLLTTVCADLDQDDPPTADLLFCDPARRDGQRRLNDPQAYSPSLTRVLSWFGRSPRLTVKLAPGIDPALLPTDAELEFVSLNGDLKEAVVWLGDGSRGRSATLLRRTDDPAQPAHAVRLTAQAHPPVALTAARAFLIEPDPAIIRAGLVTTLADRIGATQLDRQIAYLTADHDDVAPYARAWPVLEQLPFNLKQLQRRLRELDAGAVTVKKRGSPLETDSLARQLSANGSRTLVVILTRLADRPTALICADVSRTW